MLELARFPYDRCHVCAMEICSDCAIVLDSSSMFAESARSFPSVVSIFGIAGTTGEPQSQAPSLRGRDRQIRLDHVPRPFAAYAVLRYSLRQPHSLRFIARYW